jgi:hypothetical protein
MPRLRKQKEVTEPFSIRWKPSERKLIEKNAKKYTGGNLTEWLIYAGTHMVPPKKDLSEDAAEREEREQTHEV